MVTSISSSVKQLSTIILKVKAIHEGAWIVVNCHIGCISSASFTCLLILPAYAVCKYTVVAMATLYQYQPLPIAYHNKHTCL